MFICGGFTITPWEGDNEQHGTQEGRKDRPLVPLVPRSTNPHGFQIQKRAELLDFVRNMSEANGAMMRRTGLGPLIDERLRFNGKMIAAVCGANLQDRAGD
jgi:hypothetical protein